MAAELNPAGITGLVHVPIYLEDLGTTRILAAYGPPVIPGSAAGMEIVSANLADTAAGTGARKVKIVYLDGNFNPFVEEIAMNGTTVVATAATDIFRVLQVYVSEAGSGNQNAGDVTLQGLSAGPIRAKLLAGHNGWYPGFYCVPAGYQAVLRRVRLSVPGTASIQAWVLADIDPNNRHRVADLFRPVAALATTSGGFEWQGRIALPEKTLVKVEAVASAAGIKLAGELTLEVQPT